MDILRRFWWVLLFPLLFTLLGGCRITETRQSRFVESIPAGPWKYSEEVMDGQIVCSAEVDPFAVVKVGSTFLVTVIEETGRVGEAVINLFGGLLGLPPLPEAPSPPEP